MPICVDLQLNCLLFSPLHRKLGKRCYDRLVQTRHSGYVPVLTAQAVATVTVCIALFPELFSSCRVEGGSGCKTTVCKLSKHAVCVSVVAVGFLLFFHGFCLHFYIIHVHLNKHHYSMKIHLVDFVW